MDKISANRKKETLNHLSKMKKRIDRKQARVQSGFNYRFNTKAVEIVNGRLVYSEHMVVSAFGKISQPFKKKGKKPHFISKSNIVKNMRRKEILSVGIAILEEKFTLYGAASFLKKLFFKF